MENDNTKSSDSEKQNYYDYLFPKVKPYIGVNIIKNEIVESVSIECN